MRQHVGRSSRSRQRCRRTRSVPAHPHDKSRMRGPPERQYVALGSIVSSVSHLTITDSPSIRRVWGQLGSYLTLWIGWGATAGAEVLLLPILSRLLSAEEYGKYLLVYGIVLFLSDAASVWASSAYVRLASASDSNARKQSRETLLAAVVVTSIAALIIEIAVGGGAWVFGAKSLALTIVASAFLLPGLG